MPLALVTGTRPHIGPAAATLGRSGFEVMSLTAESSTASATGPFDCYVQLPCTSDGLPALRPSDELVWRIDTLAAIAGRLRPNASVLLAVEEAGSSADLLAAVALATLEDLGHSTDRLAVLQVAELCRRVPARAPLHPLVATDGQWEMPTPPLVSAP